MRRKVLPVSPEALMSIFEQKGSFRIVHRHDDIPADVRVVSVNTDWHSGMVVLLLESESFPEVMEGQEYPRLGVGQLYAEPLEPFCVANVTVNPDDVSEVVEAFMERVQSGQIRRMPTNVEADISEYQLRHPADSAILVGISHAAKHSRLVFDDGGQILLPCDIDADGGISQNGEPAVKVAYPSHPQGVSVVKRGMYFQLGKTTSHQLYRHLAMILRDYPGDLGHMPELFNKWRGRLAQQKSIEAPPEADKPTEIVFDEAAPVDAETWKTLSKESSWHYLDVPESWRDRKPLL